MAPKQQLAARSVAAALLVMTLIVATVVDNAEAFGMGLEGMGGIPAAASNLEASRATGHAMAAENQATEAAVDRAHGNPLGAAFNERGALINSMASNAAAGRSALDASLAGGMGGSAGAALGAGMAANSASMAAGGPMAGFGTGVGPLGLGMGMPGYGLPGFGFSPLGTLPGPFPGSIFPGSFFPGLPGGHPAFPFPGFFGGYFPGFMGLYGGGYPYRGLGLRDPLVVDPALRMQREAV